MSLKKLKNRIINFFHKNKNFKEVFKTEKIYRKWKNELNSSYVYIRQSNYANVYLTLYKTYNAYNHIMMFNSMYMDRYIYIIGDENIRKFYDSIKVISDKFKYNTNLLSSENLCNYVKKINDIDMPECIFIDEYEFDSYKKCSSRYIKPGFEFRIINNICYLYMNTALYYKRHGKIYKGNEFEINLGTYDDFMKMITEDLLLDNYSKLYTDLEHYNNIIKKLK